MKYTWMKITTKVMALSIGICSLQAQASEFQCTMGHKYAQLSSSTLGTILRSNYRMRKLSAAEIKIAEGGVGNLKIISAVYDSEDGFFSSGMSETVQYQQIVAVSPRSFTNYSPVTPLRTLNAELIENKVIVVRGDASMQYKKSIALIDARRNLNQLKVYNILSSDPLYPIDLYNAASVPQDSLPVNVQTVEDFEGVTTHVLTTFASRNVSWDNGAPILTASLCELQTTYSYRNAMPTTSCASHAIFNIADQTNAPGSIRESNSKSVFRMAWSTQGLNIALMTDSSLKWYRYNPQNRSFVLSNSSFLFGIQNHPEFNWTVAYGGKVYASYRDQQNNRPAVVTISGGTIAMIQSEIDSGDLRTLTHGVVDPLRIGSVTTMGLLSNSTSSTLGTVAVPVEHIVSHQSDSLLGAYHFHVLANSWGRKGMILTPKSFGEAPSATRRIGPPYNFNERALPEIALLKQGAETTEAHILVGNELYVSTCRPL